MTSQLTRRRAVVIGGSVVVAGSVAPAVMAGPVAGASKKVLYFTKSSGFQHSVVRRPGSGELAFSERLLIGVAKEHDIEVTATKDGTVFDKEFENYDGFVFYTTGDLTKTGTDKQPAMSAQGKQNLLDAIKAGKGFAGSHCACDTFHTPGDRFRNQDVKDPYIAMLGGEFIRHGRQQKATMTVVNPKFPGMAAAEERFAMLEEWYSIKNFASDLHVLLVNETTGMEGPDYQRPPFPATWVRAHGQGRVFYTSMGHREDVWSHHVFQSIFMGGLKWSLAMADADIPPNIAKVTPQAHVMPPQR